MSVASTANKPHIVYRCYDATDRLIYVGCTSVSIERRMYGHRSKNPAVVEQTARVETEQYPDRATAQCAEYFAIERERPTLNVRRGAYSALPEPTPEQLRAAIDRLPSLLPPKAAS